MTTQPTTPVQDTTKGPYLEPGLLVSSLRRTTSFAFGESVQISEQRLEYGMSVGGGWGIPFLWDTILDVNVKYVFDGLFSAEIQEQELHSIHFLVAFVFPIWSGQSEQ